MTYFSIFIIGPPIIDLGPGPACSTHATHPVIAALATVLKCYTTI